MFPRNDKYICGKVIEVAVIRIKNFLQKIYYI